MGGINSHFFLPFENPIGFGVSDFVELAAALLLVYFALVRPWVEPAASQLARRTVWSMLLLATAPVVLRLALLASHPAPSPRSPVEFSHLLVADTLAHFRLANPAHPMHRFFETLWVLQQPAYSSIFPVGPGLALAFGRLAFGHPWAGVVLCVSAFCALCYWMLRAWTTPGWAMLGGVLSVLEFGPLSAWMNSYSGGALAAAAGCLVAGSLPRLRDRGHIRDGVLLGTGLAAALLTSVDAFVLLLLIVVVFFVLTRRWRGRAFVAAGLIVMAGIAITLLHDKQTTGSWTTRPETVYRAVTPEQILASRVQTKPAGYYRFSSLAPAITGLFVLLAVVALERLSLLTIRGWPVGSEAARLIVFLCFAQFVLWYGLYAFAPPNRSPIRPQPDRASGRCLVFVRYGPRHRFTNEWVYNDAGIDGARVVWARDLGPRENANLRRYYPDRSVWLLDADALDPALSPYEPEPPAAEPLPPEPAIRNKKPTTLRFEEVPDVR
jgi:hypothetical protein